jgi:hypothetical protein
MSHSVRTYLLAAAGHTRLSLRAAIIVNILLSLGLWAVLRLLVTELF